MPSPRSRSTARCAYRRTLRRTAPRKPCAGCHARGLAEPLGASAGRMFHFITRASPPVTPPAGATLPLAAATLRKGPVPLSHLTDRDRLTMWETPEGQRRGHQLRLTLACTATVQSVGLLQDGGRFARRLAIEVSGDGDGLAAGLGRNDGGTGRSGGAARSPAAVDRYSRHGRRCAGDPPPPPRPPTRRPGGRWRKCASAEYASPDAATAPRRQRRQTRARSVRG